MRLPISFPAARMQCPQCHSDVDPSAAAFCPFCDAGLVETPQSKAKRSKWKQDADVLGFSDAKALWEVRDTWSKAGSLAARRKDS